MGAHEALAPRRGELQAQRRGGEPQRVVGAPLEVGVAEIRRAGDHLARRGQRGCGDPVTIRHLLSHAAGLPEDDAWADRQLALGDATFSALLRRGLPFALAPTVPATVLSLDVGVVASDGHGVRRDADGR